MSSRALKRELQRGLRLWPVRMVTLALIGMSRALARVASQARLRALAPHAGDCICHWSVELKYPERIRFGTGVIIGPHSTIGAAAPVVLEDHVRLSKGVVIETAGLDFTGEPPYPHVARPIHVERGAWIGAGAMILGGVRLGAYCVVGAGTVVSRDVPAYAIVTGAGVRVHEKAPDPMKAC